MRFRKSRIQKLFDEKFQKNTDKVDNHLWREVSNMVGLSFDRFKKRKHSGTVTNFELKEILVENNLYNGSFYISPELINHKLLNLNLEDVYLNLSKLDKQDHGDKCWSYNQDEFQKVFVIYNDGEKALCALAYGDSFCPYIIDVFYTINLYFEGNIGKNII